MADMPPQRFVAALSHRIQDLTWTPRRPTFDDAHTIRETGTKMTKFSLGAIVLSGIEVTGIARPSRGAKLRKDP
jgi:hypothetical protein